MTTPIIHVDMDAFFAAVEMRDNPELRGKPVIIGGDPLRDVRSVVSTASYEARKFGVHSAMPLIQAWHLCPKAIFLRGNMARYSQVSSQIMTIFSRYTPLVEPLSIDEAFLDVTGCERLFGSPEEIAARIQKDVSRELELSCSVGVAPNKFLAKLASDLKKPGGITIIRPDEIEQILYPLPITKLWGVGEKTAVKLRNMGIDTIGQLACLPEPLLAKAFGKLGVGLWHLSRGEDVRAVETTREIKSVSRETTFPRDVTEMGHLHAVILELADDVARTLRTKELLASTVVLKLRYGNFEIITRQGTLPSPACLAMPIYTRALELLSKIGIGGRGIRLVGVGACGLVDSANQRQLCFFEAENIVKEEKITKAVDKVSARYGYGVVKRAALIGKKIDDNTPQE
jgi:nucleotidyltransferase/DNA polymerase involved in DNA repair